MNKSLKIIIPITLITIIAVVTIILVLVLGKKKKNSGGGPSPGPPPSPTTCPHLYINPGKCPSIKPAQDNIFPPPPNAVLENCNKDFTNTPCLNTISGLPTGKIKSPNQSAGLFKACIYTPPNTTTYKYCPIGSACVAQTQYYSQCVPVCKDTPITNCCNFKDGCEKCEVEPTGGSCKDTIFKKNTKWTSYNIETNVCAYKGGDGKWWYDGGAACSELLCEHNKGTWMNAKDVGHNKNIVKINASLSSYFNKDEDNKNYYILNKDLDIKQNCTGVSSIIDSNSIVYSLVSIKPSNWNCPKFSSWDKCSQEACEKNCKKNFSDYPCEELCKPIKLTDPNLVTYASTTDFGFGAATSCNCNGKEIMKILSGESTGGKPFHSKGDDKTGEGKGYWVGVASPSWVQSPFNTTTTSGIAGGGSTIANKYGTKYTSNCSSGNGGCGTCWELSTDDKKINAVVIDTCEDANAYGNNYNWCVAQRPDVKAWTPNPNYTYSGNWPPFFEQLPYTSTGNKKNEYGKMIWDSPECFDKQGNFICKNMDFHPLHFDVATQQLPDNVIDTMNMWHKSTNPKVKAKRIKCPADLKNDVITQHCGNKSGSDATPDEYCPGHDDKVYFSPQNLDGWWPK